MHHTSPFVLDCDDNTRDWDDVIVVLTTATTAAATDMDHMRAGTVEKIRQYLHAQALQATPKRLLFSCNQRVKVYFSIASSTETHSLGHWDVPRLCDGR